MHRRRRLAGQHDYPTRELEVDGRGRLENDLNLSRARLQEQIGRPGPDLMQPHLQWHCRERALRRSNANVLRPPKAPHSWQVADQQHRISVARERYMDFYPLPTLEPRRDGDALVLMFLAGIIEIESHFRV